MKKAVLITGASSGLGKAVAEKLLSTDNWAVYATARSVEKMKSLEESGAHIIKVDVTSADDVDAAVRRIIKEQGRIDVLVNNAGYGSYGTIEDMPPNELERQFDVNVFGPAKLIQAVLPHMRKQKSGRIINMSSVVGIVSMPMLGWYAATKHAMEAFSDALRLELKGTGIDIVKIRPGAVKTEFDEVSFAALDKVNISDDYVSLIDKVRKVFENAYSTCEGPENTANIVVRAMETDKPKIAYATTKDSRQMTMMKKLMGERRFGDMLHKMMTK